MTGPLNKSLGLKIRAARKRAGLTQERLAAQISRTPESVSNIERGEQLPSVETLADLGRVLGVPIAEFFEEVGTAPNGPPERIRLEARLREAVRQLSDRDLAVAVKQIDAFLGHPLDRAPRMTK